MKTTILITGVCGTIGRELARQHLKQGDQVIGLDYNENALAILEKELNHQNFVPVPFDVYATETVDIVEKLQPSIIIHGAVSKNTQYNEQYKAYYYRLNVEYTIKFLYDMLNKPYVQRFIFLSSDEAYEPNYAFGRDKQEVEKIIRIVAYTNKIVQAIRFPFMMQSKGSVYHIFKKQAKQNLPLTVTHKDIKKIATSVSDFLDSWAVFYTHVKESGVFNMNIGEEISIYNLAVSIIKETQSNSSIVISGLRKGEIVHRIIDTTADEHVIGHIYRVCDGVSGRE